MTDRIVPPKVATAPPRHPRLKHGPAAARGRCAATTFPFPGDKRRAFKTGTARQPMREAVVTWIILIIAGLFEVVWATAMKQSHGFTRPVASVVTVAAMLVSFGLLARAMRVLPLGTAYMVWTGIGAIGAFLVGAAVMNEPVTPARLLAAGLILAGLILIKLVTPA